MTTVRNGLLAAATVVLIGSLAWAQHRPPCRGGEHLTATGWCEGGSPAAPPTGGGRPRHGQGGRPVSRGPEGACPPEMVYVPSAVVGGLRIDAFCLDRTEVTTEAYGGCSSCSAPGTGDACNWGVAGRNRHPINCVDWNQAVAFCESRDARLPTESEWQFAAQGTDAREYPWGSRAPSNQLCWTGVHERSSTCVVGSFPAGRSSYGAEDMSGNVWEWTSTADGANRVNRGGGWPDYDAARVRAAYRGTDAPANWYSDLGFRCARGGIGVPTPQPFWHESARVYITPLFAKFPLVRAVESTRSPRWRSLTGAVTGASVGDSEAWIIDDNRVMRLGSGRATETSSAVQRGCCRLR